MLRRLAVLLTLVLALACSDAASEPEARPSASTVRRPSCEPGRPAPGGTTRENLDTAGGVRPYSVHVPAGYGGSEPVALVVTLHGLRSNDAQQLRYSRWTELADAEGFVVVAPQANGDPSIWNVLAPPSDLASDARNILDVVGETASRLCIDEDRVYVNGMSMGSAMTQMLACTDDGTFAAFAGVAAAIRPPPLCGDARPSPFRYFHGTADPIVPFAGGQSVLTIVRSAPEIMAEWAAGNGCDAVPTDEQISAHVTRQTWSACDADAEVVFDIIDGGGHTWPGSIPIAAFGPTTNEIDATDEMWAFFEAHQRAP